MTCSASFVSIPLRPAATSDVAWFRRIRALRIDQPPDWMISAIFHSRFLEMTNDTTPTENGAADAATMLAAMQNDTPTIGSATSEVIPEEPKPPSFDDLGLNPDVKLALDDMGYFAPTPVQTAVFVPVSE